MFNFWVIQKMFLRFVEKGYNEWTIRKQIKRVDYLDRSLLLKHCSLCQKDLIPNLLKYNSLLSHIKEIMNRHWHRNIKEIFNNIQPMIALHKNTSLKQVIGTNTMRTKNSSHPHKQYTQCYTSQSLCCQEILKATTFTSTQTRDTFTVFHQGTCQSNYVIYFLECVICKIQYVRESETSFNIRLNNHRKDTENPVYRTM